MPHFLSFKVDPARGGHNEGWKVRTRKAERFQIINRFKDFRIRLNRLYRREHGSNVLAHPPEKIGNPFDGRWKNRGGAGRLSVTLPGAMPHFVPNLSAKSPFPMQEGTPAHEGAT
jgi:hypothetical protein